MGSHHPVISLPHRAGSRPKHPKSQGFKTKTRRATDRHPEYGRKSGQREVGLEERNIADVHPLPAKLLWVNPYKKIRIFSCAYQDHFHVHIVNASYAGLMGMAVGQAHLLDDIISLVSQVEAVIPSYHSDREEQARDRLWCISENDAHIWPGWSTWSFRGNARGLMLIME